MSNRVGADELAAKKQGITPIVDFLKANGVSVGQYADVGDSLFRTPRIWFFAEGESEGLKVMELVEGFAYERGYKLSRLRKEWYAIHRERPCWVLVFCIPDFAKGSLADS